MHKNKVENMETEIWKVYEITEAGKYPKDGSPRSQVVWEVSNLGRIRKTSQKTGKVTYITQQECGGGPGSRYLCVPSNREKYVHRIVAKAFIPNDKPDTHTCVDHIDFNKKNNAVENLRWVTYNFNSNRRDIVCPHCGKKGKGNGFMVHVKSCPKNPNRVPRNLKTNSWK